MGEDICSNGEVELNNARPAPSGLSKIASASLHTFELHRINLIFLTYISYLLKYKHNLYSCTLFILYYIKYELLYYCTLVLV